MDINLEQYRVFYEVSRSGSITAAARTLCVSQPAVSQSLRQLEESLGSQLFVRTPKGVRLTQAGQLLSTYVSRGLESILDGEKLLKKLNNLEEGEVRIGASDMTLQFFLLPYLEQFHEAHPRLKVTVTNGPTPETLTLLSAGRMDFGVVTAPFEERSEFEWRTVRQVQDCFIAGSKFRELAGRTLPFAELLSLPLICLEKNTSSRRYLDEYLAKRQVCLEPEFELATSDMIVQFAIRSLGIGCVMQGFAEEALRRKQVFLLKFDEELPPRDMCIVTDRRSPLSSAAQALLNLIMQEQEREPGEG